MPWNSSLNRRSSLRDSYAAKLKREGRTPRPRKAPLRRQSAKAKAAQPARRACCEAVRERSQGRCEVRISPECSGRMDHTHEIKARSAGGSITDPENCLGTCFFCHDWIGAHANKARKLGLVAPRGV